MDLSNKYELLKFKDGEFELDVSVSPSEDTVYLTQIEMAKLFGTVKNTIAYHISNILAENELGLSTTQESWVLDPNGKRRLTKLYNLDMILAVGYRVKSTRGNQFRIWANSILKQYIKEGAAINVSRCVLCEQCKGILDERFRSIENKIMQFESKCTNSLTLKEGERIDTMFMILEIMKSAKRLLVIVDNYFDHSFDEILLHSPAKVVIITHPKNKDFVSDKYKVIKTDKFHDRYLFVDDKSYHFGESFNKLGTDISTCNFMPNFTIEQFLELTGIKI